MPAFLRSLARNRYFWFGLLALFAATALIYLVLNFLIMPAYTRQDVAITVPDVRNLPYDRAVEQLEERGLRVERIVQRYTRQYGPNVVTDQSPAPRAQVKPNRRVYLTVNSAEAPTVRVPDLKNISLREAQNRLIAAGLAVGATIQDTIPSPYPNTVTGQEPAPGTELEEGASVTLWYSAGLGNEVVTVPDVTNKTVEEAARLLLEARLRAVVVGADTRSDAMILRQNQTPGTSLQTGTEVRLYTDESAEPAPEPATPQ